MKLQIGGFTPPAGEETADALLRACHQRIRHFTGMSRKLATTSGLPADQIRDAAARTRRYFAEALPKHATDEEQSIAPRLLSRNLSGPERAAVESMVSQHGPIDATLAALSECWRQLEQNPETLSAQVPELLRLTRELESQWDEHLAMEESVVFPAMQRELSTDEHAEILAEMRRRRVPPAS